MTDYGVLVNIGKGDGTKTGPLTRIDGTPVQRLEKMVASFFRGFAQNHPCIGARSVFANGNMYFAIIPDMASVESAVLVVDIVEQYLKISDKIDDYVKTLALVFFDTSGSQEEFATKYWSFVQKVHDVDSICNDWDESVSSDLNSREFELSIAGRAIFTTTLNPASPRIARKFGYPVWVCNQTRQFDRLRELGQFEKWQVQIRKADAELDPSGTHNPILVDHGQGSAVLQLAGSPVTPCPLIIRTTAQSRALAAGKLLMELRTEDADTTIVDRLRQRCERGGILLG